jgi:hypothetical protein
MAHPVARVALLGASLLLNTACAVFVPAHEHSFDREGEQVVIRPLLMADLSDVDGDQKLDVTGDYEAVFGVKPTATSLAKKAPGGGATSQGTAALIAMVGGAVVDDVKRRIEREAESYEQQFEGSFTSDRFYTNTGGPTPELEQRVFGFEIKRTTTASGHEAGEFAFRLILGVHYSEANHLFRVAPLWVQTRSTRAKVLNTDFHVAWIWQLLLNDGDLVDSSVEIKITSTHVDRKGKVVHAPVGPTIPLDFKSYDLSKQQVLRAKPVDKAEGQLRGGDLGWIAPIPVRQDEKKFPLGDGAYRIEVVVTEKDPSNAKEYLTQAAEYVEEKGDEALADFR